MISLTIDLEDPLDKYEPDGRYVIMTRKILELCDQRQCKATFFIIGRVAESAPRLIQEIAHKGHEVAYHTHAHISLTKENPARFRRETATDKDKFEQLTGKPLLGFRAPRFSLTPKSLWAVDALGELGFAYSSSIMPTNISLYGYPEASRTVSRWPNGLIEFPLPVADFGPLRIPYLGGIYLYVLPSLLTRYWVKKANSNEVLWTYTHPYDFDREEKFTRMPNEPLWVSALLWASRRVAEKKITNLLKLGAAETLGERARAFMSHDIYS